MAMDDAMLETLAGEAPENQHRRAVLTSELERLNDGLVVCQNSRRESRMSREYYHFCLAVPKLLIVPC